MRVLVMGGAGMLGHKLLQVLGARFETWAAVRALSERLVELPGVHHEHVISGVNADALESIVRAFAIAKPEVVINCIGIVKQRAEAKDPIRSIRTNSLFPHQLHDVSKCSGSRLIHISTDCVFSGRTGGYVETDEPDATDLYGRTKLLGEVADGGALTLRTSIIGRELSSTNGIVEWFLSNRGRAVQGFPRAVFSGLPTVELAHVIADVVEKHVDMHGLYHVGAAPIDKHQLLQLMNEAFDARVRIGRDDSVVVDRSLDSSRFRKQTGYVPDNWATLVSRMVEDAGHVVTKGF